MCAALDVCERVGTGPGILQDFEQQLTTNTELLFYFQQYEHLSNI